MAGSDKTNRGRSYIPLPVQLAVSGAALVVPDATEEFVRDDMVGLGAAVDLCPRRFFVTALCVHGGPIEVVTDRAWTLLAVVDELLPDGFHNTAQYANNRMEADHGRLKARLRPMRGLKRDHSARVIVRGHAFMQNLRRGHYELGVDVRAHRRVAVAFTELSRVI